MTPAHSASNVRPAFQAGRFYDADPGRLRHLVERLLAEAEPVPLPGAPVALVAPHAGYLYSGRVAAATYRQLAQHPPTHVLLLAPSHYVDFSGAALPSADAFATPLGEVALDRPAIEGLLRHPGFTLDDDVHNPEHSLEVQLPFLQLALGRPFLLLPVALGRPPHGADLEPLAAPLLALLRERAEAGERWIILASTDTYHGYDPGACELNDVRLGRLIEELDPAALFEQSRSGAVMACGWLPLALAADLARRQGARRGHLLRRADSRSGAGPVSGYVVGYLSAAFV